MHCGLAAERFNVNRWRWDTLLNFSLQYLGERPTTTDFYLPLKRRSKLAWAMDRNRAQLRPTGEESAQVGVSGHLNRTRASEAQDASGMLVMTHARPGH